MTPFHLLQKGCFVGRYLVAVFGIIFLILCFVIIVILLPILQRNIILSYDDNAVKPTVFNTRLPTALKPVTYRLKLQPYFPSSVNYPSERNFTFDAEVIIEFNCVAPTNNITLHSHGLKFIDQSIQVKSIKGQNIQISNNGIRLNRIKQHLVIFLGTVLTPGETYTITLKFNGLITKVNNGIFVSNYTENGRERFILVTDMEGSTNTSSYSRNVFPCFDEPAYKAKFSFSLIHPSDLVALSNGEILKSNVIGNGWSETEFSETHPMSTYLLAITIGDLVGKFTVSDMGTKIGIWTWPSMANYTDLALQIARKSLDFYGNYFDSPFHLPKADFIGLPVFKSEATEFWGIIIFSYEQLLFDASIQTTEEKTLIINTINHEIGHQWFGNLVTMAWWDDLFLAEGLTQYYQYMAAMEIFPQQSAFMYQYYVSFIQWNALNADFRPNAHPEHYKYGPDFGPLTYDKGAVLVRMLNYTLGSEVLKQGFTQYLKQYSFSYANYVQLFDVLTKVAQEAGIRDWNGMSLNVTEMMEYWMNQPGFPVVSVERNQNITTVTLANDHGFSFPTKLHYNNDGIVQSDWLFNNKIYDKNEASFYTNKYFIANVEGGAYASVQYDENSWLHLMEQINKDPTILDLTNKAKLFVDLTYKGPQATDIKRFLDLSLTLIGETSAKTWEVVIPVFEYINNMFRNHENYWMIKKYLRQLIEFVLNSEIKKDWNAGLLQYVVEQNETGILHRIVRSTLGYSAILAFIKNNRKQTETEWKEKFAEVLAPLSSTQEQLENEDDSFSSIDCIEKKRFNPRYLVAVFAVLFMILSFVIIVVLLPILQTKTVLFYADTAMPAATVLSTRLPTALTPVTYRLKLQPYFPNSISYPSGKNFTFEGEVIIEFICVVSTNNITIHSNGLNIYEESIVVNSLKGQKIEIANNGIRLNRAKHHLVIFLEKQLTPGETYSLRLKFNGFIRKDANNGMFVSSYTENGKQKFVVATEFEGSTNTTSYARNVFPCFDEPAYKAKFSVTLVHPSDLVALSNGEIRDTKVIGDGWTETEFSETPPMSTYLLAITIGDLVGKFTVSKTGTKIGVWAWPATANYTDLALSTARQSIEFFENYFDSPFPLPKADFIALPVFQSGATEFWGIIIFSYKQLLFDANVQTTEDEILVIDTINHEIAHQWFGNLVTMTWWDDLFLAEGLAQYYQYIATMEIYPKQATFMYQYYVAYEQEKAFNAECRPNAHPEHYKDGPAFGALTYDKGAALVRMLNYTLGFEVLKEGISQYLKEYTFSNANYTQFFDTLTEVAQEAGITDWNGMSLNVTEMMEYWMNQPGFPVVSVKRDQNETTVALTNDRGFWFPIKLLSNNDGIISSHWLFNNKIYDKDETSLYTSKYFIANVEGGAYAPVQYDENSWKLLMEQINNDPTILDSTTKAKLFVDLTYKGTHSTDIKRFLDLSLTLINETSAKTWEVAIPVFQYINDMFRNHKKYWMIQKYISQLIESVLELKIEKDWNGGVLINKLLRLDVTNVDQFINLPLLKQYLNCSDRNHTNSTCWIDPDLRPAVYCALISTRGSMQFEYVWLKLQTENSRKHLPYFEAEKEALLYGLSCTRSSTQLQRLVQYVVVQNEANVLKDIARSNSGYSAMSAFFKNKRKRTKTEWRDKFVDVLAPLSSTQEQLENLQNLSKNPKITKAVKTNIRWLKENENIVIEWLKKNVRFL